ncbi:uncharacterized protein A4U43_C03F23360 [Asparagus officinalis]|uniref:Uncharacterized protein n=1 Tax=Asparagus officinalis TaxID=4686 RepID=A0A5P1FHC9_ASPOF|nr:uncharacterized protein A4U43_C03F23360 [Asparagus officinalis]
MYATCQQLQAQAQAHITELRLHVPRSIGFSTRGRLQSLRLQLALLDREFDDLVVDHLSNKHHHALLAYTMTQHAFQALYKLYKMVYDDSVSN